MTERLTKIEQNEHKYRYSIITGFTCVRIFSPDDISFNPYDILTSRPFIDRRVIGGLCIADESVADRKVEKYPVINLILEMNSSPSLKMYNSSFFKLTGPFQRKEFYSRLPYIVYNIGERARQETLNMVSLHAAAVVTNDGKSLLILGDKGSGKTLFSLVLGLQYNFGIIGNDLVLIQEGEEAEGGVFIRAGTQLFDVRSAVIRYYLPQLKPENLGAGNPYEEKITLLPEEIGITLGQDRSGVSAVIRINIHPYNEETKIEKGARRTQETLRLRENLARYIRGVVTPLMLDEKNSGGYFPSLDSEGLAHKRDRIIERILESNFIYAFGNDPRRIADKILSLL